MKSDYEIIKKWYGEKMAKLCRKLFPTLFEEKGLLPRILSLKFNNTYDLYYDLIKSNHVYEFKDYIYSLTNVEKKETESTISTRELLQKAGYNLYECKTEKEIQLFKKYYIEEEELCTFEGNRLDSCYVFFAVKENVNEIKRENFSNPMREDAYGTSVLSIQFDKGIHNILSIKNRYNHSVTNPDATFSNNLDNIIPGLTRAFSNDYNLNIIENKPKTFELPNYVIASDGKYYKYNYEIENVYYCPNNIIINNGKVQKFDKEKYVVLDYFVLDLMKKEIIVDPSIADSFIDGLIDIKTIKITKEAETKRITITPKSGKNVIIIIDSDNNIIKYENENITDIGDNFLCFNKTATNINLLNVKTIGDKFLSFNTDLKHINLSNVEDIGCNFLYYNNSLRCINLSKVINIGEYSLSRNNKIESLELPNVEIIGNAFLQYNKLLQYINFPKIKIIGKDTLKQNKNIDKSIIEERTYNKIR